LCFVQQPIGNYRQILKYLSANFCPASITL
jgi:hypothetical protein